MSYLSEPSSKTIYGVVKIGDYIDVSADGIISIKQDVSPTADVKFNLVDAKSVSSDGKTVVTSVTPAAGNGISLSSIVSGGPSTSFSINNTGVLSLIAGSGIKLSGATGNITISSEGADLISVYGTTTSYTATATDEYIGVSSVNSITITLPTGVNGRVYTIKDEYGQGSGKITIQPQINEKIDGKSNYIISVPYQSISIVFRGDQWRVI